MIAYGMGNIYSPVVGLDFRINIAQFRLDYKGEGYLSGEYKQESLSLLPKAGIVYDMNDSLSALLTAGYNFDIWSNAPFGEKLFPYLTVAATLIYYFE